MKVFVVALENFIRPFKNLGLKKVWGLLRQLVCMLGHQHVNQLYVGNVAWLPEG